MPCDIKAFLKTGQVLVCGIGIIYMVLSTWEYNRITRMLQKKSLEGRWASFTNKESLAFLFINLTFGTYFIITFCLLIGHIYGDNKTIGEILLLLIGCLMMIAVGGILVVSIDDVPDKLFINIIILGVLALLAGVLLLTDAGTKCASKPRVKKTPSAVTKKKKEIEIAPSQKIQQEPQLVEQKVHEEKNEEPKKENEIPVKESGISSVEIRIKDPNKNWPVYGEKARATSEIDVLAEAEAVDKMLTRGVALGRARGQLPRMSESPVRHTSSFYINQPPQFAWKRLSER